MNHKPYEDMIFASDQSTSADRTLLHDHLVVCEECRNLSQAWEHVTLELKASPMAAPAPGFTARWMKRLEANLSRQQRWQSLLILAFCLLGAVLLLGGLALLSLPVAESPLVLIMAWISKVWVLFSTARLLQNMVATLFNALVNTVPPYWLIFVFGVGSLMAVVWAASVRVLTMPRRVSK